MDEPLDINLEPDDEQPTEDIIVTNADVRPPPPVPPTYIPSRVFTPIRKSTTAVMFRGLIGRNLTAAISSTFAVSIILQIFFRSSALAAVSENFGVSALVTALYLSTAAGAIGAALAAIEAVTQGNRARAASRAVVGLLFGVIGGLIGGILAQAVAATLLRHAGAGNAQNAAIAGEFFGSLVGWGVAGFAIGLGRGFGLGQEQVKNGLLSGIIGGVIGGLAIGLLATSFASAVLSRLVSLFIFGICVGGAAAGIDETRRSSWLLVEGGLLQGADYTLLPGYVQIGSSTQCDIILSGPSVAPIHCSLEIDYSQVTVTARSAQIPTLINGQSRRSHTLFPGDVIQIGNNLLRYCEKE